MTSRNGAYFSSEQLKQVDHLMATHYNISELQLMACAGLRLAEFSRDILMRSGPISKETSVSIVVGKGNNGGDGLVAARYLSNWGLQVHLILACQPQQLHPLPSQHLKTLNHLPVHHHLDNTSCLIQVY